MRFPASITEKKIGMFGGAQHPRPSRVGQFVKSTVEDAEVWGIGKLVDVQAGLATLAYFDSPAHEERVQRTVPLNSIRCVSLEPQVRVYYRDPSTLHWQVGRVLDYQPSDHKYLVRFPNDERRLILETELETRWARPILDPTDHLALQLNETPFWHDGRQGFIHSVFAQRRGCGGMTALLSSSIDVVEHQIAVARRILLDPFQRYILADEVGLGKTIEAGILIRQFVLDHPREHSILIVVPETLIAQWCGELRHRFHLDDQLDDTIHVVGHRQVDAIRPIVRDAGMIVVDEAHHIAAWARSSVVELATIYELISEATRPQERSVLLLSATPVLHNEWAFLAMLHLIDPLVYSLDDFDAFRKKVSHRQQIADVLMSLTDDESNFFLRQSLNNINGLLIDDKRFQVLSRSLVDLLAQDVAEDDEERSRQIRALRLHISETWRLHRRLLRNRRSERTEFLVPGRAGLELSLWHSPDVAPLEDLLAEWRQMAGHWLYGREPSKESDHVRQLAIVLADVAMCDPEALCAVVEERLEGGSAECDALGLFDSELQAVRQAPLLDGERSLLTQISDAASKLRQGARFEALENVIALLTSDVSAAPVIVIFATHPATANRIAHFLKRRLGDERVVRHDPESSRWTRFLGPAKGQILVCDRRVEEGLNLQNRRSVVIHFDLPLSPNRIEQRMGRLDRFGTGLRIKSYAMVCETSELQRAWSECLAEAFLVFNQSIASLQYVVEEELRQIRQDFPDAGVDAIRNASLRLSGRDGVIQREFRRIRAQDELDAFGDDDVSSESFVQALQKIDVDSAKFRQEFEDWFVGRLHFRKSGEEGRDDGVVRYQYCRRNDFGRGFGKDTLVPECSFVEHFQDSLDEVDDANVQNPLILYETVPVSFDRQIAQRRLTRLARTGDPLVDALERFTRWDDRGICFAMWRYRPAIHLGGPVEMAFCFHFTVESSAAPLKQLSQKWPEVCLTALRRRADMAFPPLSVALWLDSDLNRITDDVRLALLRERYRSETLPRKSQSGRDFNLNTSRWRTVSEHYDILVWRGLCHAAREQAEVILREQTRLPALTQERSRQAAVLAERRIQQHESRTLRGDAESSYVLSRELDFERDFATALQTSILKPAIHADSAGVVFLSSQNPFTDESTEDDD